MVINIESGRYSTDRPTIERRATRRAPGAQQPARSGESLRIGILNNMAGAAFKTTERQFVTLLDVASQGIPIQISFYMLPGLSRSESGGLQFASHYSDVDALLNTQLDGLIVTGREPRMASLRDEPYWESFTQVLDWARGNTLSTVWSCLAAHAAVLHMDGIGRRKRREKKFGVFECSHNPAHPLAQGLPPQSRVPHSRWNGVAEDDLAARGYGVVSRIDEGEVDAFVKDEGSLFVFFQGHLEYDTDTLMREYRRDVARYLKGDIESYPGLPHGYFDAEGQKALDCLKERAIAGADATLLQDLAAVLDKAHIQNAWRTSASKIYKNWLDWIWVCKSESRSPLLVNAGPRPRAVQS